MRVIIDYELYLNNVFGQSQIVLLCLFQKNRFNIFIDEKGIYKFSDVCDFV